MEMIEQMCFCLSASDGPATCEIYTGLCAFLLAECKIKQLIIWHLGCFLRSTLFTALMCHLSRRDVLVAGLSLRFICLIAFLVVVMEF